MTFKTALLIAVILQVLALLCLVIIRLGEIQEWPVFAIGAYEPGSFRTWMHFLVNFFWAASFLMFLTGLYRKAARGV